MTVADDLAAMRSASTAGWFQRTADRVEAEIGRLREENETLRDKLASWEEAEDEDDGREPDGHRIEGGRVIPTDR